MANNDRSKINHDEIRRARKAAQKAQARKGRNTGDEQVKFSLRDYKADKKAQRQALAFGQNVNKQINRWLDEATSKPVEIHVETDVERQALAELIGWLNNHRQPKGHQFGLLPLNDGGYKLAKAKAVAA